MGALQPHEAATALISAQLHPMDMHSGDDVPCVMSALCDTIYQSSRCMSYAVLLYEASHSNRQ